MRSANQVAIVSASAIGAGGAPMGIAYPAGPDSVPEAGRESGGGAAGKAKGPAVVGRAPGSDGGRPRAYFVSGNDGTTCSHSGCTGLPPAWIPVSVSRSLRVSLPSLPSPMRWSAPL